MRIILDGEIRSNSEEGGWIIRQIGDRSFEVLEIPLYGGEARALKICESIPEALTYAESLT